MAIKAQIKRKRNLKEEFVDTKG